MFKGVNNSRIAIRATWRVAATFLLIALFPMVVIAGGEGPGNGGRQGMVPSERAALDPNKGSGQDRVIPRAIRAVGRSIAGIPSGTGKFLKGSAFKKIALTTLVATTLTASTVTSIGYVKHHQMYSEPKAACAVDASKVAPETMGSQTSIAQRGPVQMNQQKLQAFLQRDQALVQSAPGEAGLRANTASFFSEQTALTEAKGTVFIVHGWDGNGSHGQGAWWHWKTNEVTALNNAGYNVIGVRQPGAGFETAKGTYDTGKLPNHKESGDYVTRIQEALGTVDGGPVYLWVESGGTVTATPALQCVDRAIILTPFYDVASSKERKLAKILNVASYGTGGLASSATEKLRISNFKVREQGLWRAAQNGVGVLEQAPSGDRSNHTLAIFVPNDKRVDNGTAKRKLVDHWGASALTFPAELGLVHAIFEPTTSGQSSKPATDSYIEAAIAFLDNGAPALNSFIADGTFETLP